jgi:hypothetical protein
VVRRKDGKYGEPLPWESMVVVQEAIDIHVEEMSLAEFMQRCVGQ